MQTEPHMTLGGKSIGRKLLIVDDERDLRQLLDHNLRQAGYRTVHAASGEEALMQVARHEPDIILLDLNLPDVSGIEVARRLKADARTRATPIIMLTARGGEADRITGLELGAEDYIAKPFSVRELVLRLDVVRRRLLSPRSDASSEKAPRTLARGPIEVDLDACLVRVGAREVPLALLELRLLVYLMEAEGRVRTREELLTHVWKYPADSETRTIETHVKRLRAKLGDAGDLIETVRSIGYRLRAR